MDAYPVLPVYHERRITAAAPAREPPVTDDARRRLGAVTALVLGLFARPDPPAGAAHRPARRLRSAAASGRGSASARSACRSSASDSAWPASTGCRGST